MPSLALELKPKGRKAAPHKAKDRYKKSLDQVKESPTESSDQSVKIQKTGDIDLVEVFDKASGAADQAGDGKSSGDDKAPKPKSETKVKRYRRRRKPRDHDRGR